MSYRKELEIKVIRTTHVVSFGAGTVGGMGTRAIDLKKYLAAVPDEAKIKCVADEVADADYEIWFEEEKQGD